MKLLNTKTISTIGFLILIALIWFIGPFFDLSSEERLILISGVMVLWVLTLLIGHVIAVRAGGLLEKMLRGQADQAVIDATADRRNAVKQLREQLLSAIHTLKTSRLGKTRGSKALYELPWYMIIGHPAAGKSTALHQSGLTFPFDQGTSVQGVGGTRNCDWFFSTEGVLLDTAGRYSTQTEHRDEWLGFLKLLKRYRSKAPVNGILIATSLPELLGYQSDDYAQYVRQIRERINEIEDIFGVRVPIYLIFTKLDLLGGFTQFFEDLDEDGRNRVWGATLSHELESDVDISREVARQCELLYRGLKQIGQEKLALTRGISGKPALFAFPHEFHSLRNGVERLVELLHEDDPYHTKPLLRGFYFTSALQSNEQPHIAAAARVSGQFGLSRSGFEPSQPSATHGFFLRDLFREILFPDQFLIMRQTRPRASRLRVTGMLAGLSVLTLSIGLLTQSWVGNQDMLDAIRINHAKAAELISHEALIDKLNSLSLMQKHLEELQQHRVNGTPWKISMGLYQGHKLEKTLRKEYFSGINALMLAPIQASLEESLKRFTPAALVATHAPAPGNSQPGGLPTEEGYEALKTYLMLAEERRHLDTDYLNDQMQRHWHSHLKAGQGEANLAEIEAEAEKLLAFYLSQLQAQAPDVPLMTNQPLIVSDARLVLRNATTRPQAKELVYNDLKARANSRYSALGITRILDGKDEGVLKSAFTVPGAFTREAWEQFMQQAIIEASRGEIKGDDWVLAVSTTQDNRSATSDEINTNRAEIEALYRADYASAWMKFLQGIAVSEHPNDVAQAARMLERLADPQRSPLKIVLQRVAFETSWDNPSLMSNAVEDARNMVSAVSPRISSRTSQIPNFTQEKSYGPLGRQFAALASITQSDHQSTPHIVVYLEHLGRLKGQLNPIASSADQPTAALKLILATLNGSGSEFSETMQYLDNTLLSAVEEPIFKGILRPLLSTPLLKSYATLLPPVEQWLNETWQSEVHMQWMTLANKYPFASNSQNEARTNEIVSMIGRGGTIDKYIEEYLNGLVVKRSGGQLLQRNWSELGVRFNPQFLESVARLSSFGNALTSSGGGSAADSSRFELRPVPTPGLSEITLEIDGQILRYRNGPQPWQAFRWPGNDTQGQGARIQVIANNGTVSTVSNKPGRMGLMKLFGESTRRLESNMSSGQMEWKFQGSEGTQQPVKFDFRMVEGLNPMLLTALGRVELPRRITQQ